MTYTDVKCPICGADAEFEENPNGEDFSVCDDGGCYDPLVEQYRCTENEDHLFYISA